MYQPRVNPSPAPPQAEPGRLASPMALASPANPMDEFVGWTMPQFQRHAASGGIFKVCILTRHLAGALTDAADRWHLQRQDHGERRLAVGDSTSSLDTGYQGSNNEQAIDPTLWPYGFNELRGEVCPIAGVCKELEDPHQVLDTYVATGGATGMRQASGYCGSTGWGGSGNSGFGGYSGL